MLASDVKNSKFHKKRDTRPNSRRILFLDNDKRYQQHEFVLLNTGGKPVGTLQAFGTTVIHAMKRARAMAGEGLKAVPMANFMKPKGSADVEHTNQAA